MRVRKEIYMLWAKRLVAYYKNTIPFDEESLITDTLRLSNPKRLYNVLCSCTYTGENNIFVGGILTKDILKVTGWKLPCKAAESQLEWENIKSRELEQKCRQYVDQKTLGEFIKNQKCMLPVEWRMFYMLYVPGTIFTPEERVFMKNNPCWLLPLVDDPQQEKGEENET